MNETVQIDYEQDFYRWTQTQAELLRQGKLTEVDLEHIAEEIESMGKSDRRTISSHLRNILLHLLKYHYQPSRRSRSGENSIDHSRREVESIIKDSPSLRAQIPELIAAGYGSARKSVSRQIRLPLERFPEACPFMVEQITGDYWPE